MAGEVGVQGEARAWEARDEMGLGTDGMDAT